MMKGSLGRNLSCRQLDALLALRRTSRNIDEVVKKENLSSFHYLKC